MTLKTWLCLLARVCVRAWNALDASKTASPLPAGAHAPWPTPRISKAPEVKHVAQRASVSMLDARGAEQHLEDFVLAFSVRCYCLRQVEGSSWIRKAGGRAVLLVLLVLLG